MMTQVSGLQRWFPTRAVTAETERRDLLDPLTFTSGECRHIPNGASPQPDEPCLRLPVSWGLRAAGEDRDRRAGTVYEPS